ncbi:MAG TPA: dienelactone hydrolase family protein [Pyrinomonadaceae bacterium]|jgi:predicted esterase
MSEPDKLKQTEERRLAAEINLYYDLALPSETSSSTKAQDARPSPLLIVLHGYGGSKRQMMREAKLLAPEGFALAALQGFHQHLKEPREQGGPLRYGFGWLTNFHPQDSIALHHHALLKLIDALVHEGIADRARVFLLGFSQSCALNYRFAFTHTESLRGVLGICGGLPGDWETGELYKQSKLSVFHLSGERDEFYPPSRTSDYAERLRERAPDVEVRGYDAGHEIVAAMRGDVRVWLQTRAAL